MQINKNKFFQLTLISCSLISASLVQANDMKSLKKEAKYIVQQFGGALKPQLKKALTEGGVERAMKVCSVKAPEIAKKLSEKTNWQVKRVSLKTRNSNAEPDVWERSVLMQFDKRQLLGEPAKKLVKAEIVNNEFRFMKAQGVAPLCLTCHGAKLSNETKKLLNEYYPNDKATGYSQGQVRGAFSLTKKL